MKNKDLLDLFSALEYVNSDTCSAKFKYGIARNKKIIENQIKILQDLIKPSDAYIQIENERLAICHKYCERDENNNPRMINNMFVMKEDTRAESDTEITEFMAKNKDIFDAAVKRSQELTALLEEEIDIPLYSIPIDAIPDTIKQSEMDVFARLDMIV